MKEFTAEQQEVLNEALEYFGILHQTLVLAEECSEVVKASTKLARSKLMSQTLFDNLTEEMADVMIMLEQMRIFYNINETDIENSIQYKIERLKHRIKEVEL